LNSCDGGGADGQLGVFAHADRAKWLCPASHACYLSWFVELFPDRRPAE
jgi:hypothetical protein